MALASINPKYDTQRSNESQDGLHFTQLGTQLFDVVVDAATDTEDDVLRMAGVPRVTDRHPNNQYLLCTGSFAKRVAPYLYEVTSQYGSVQSTLADLDTNPLNAAPIVTFGSVVVEEPFDIDADGNPMQFVTGEQIDPPIRIPVEDDTIDVVKNVPSYDPGFWSSYARSVNSDPVQVRGYTLPPGTVHLTARGATSNNSPNFSYWTMHASFQVRRAHPNSTDDKAWYARQLAAGYYECLPTELASPLVVRAVDKFGAYATKPILHDKTTGVRIATKTNGLADPTLAQWYEFKIFKPMPYMALGVFS